MAEVGDGTRGSMYIREWVIKVRESYVRRGKSVCEQSSCKLLANLGEMRLVIVWGTPLDVVEGGSEVKEAAVEAVCLGRGGARVVGVSPIPWRA